MQFEVLISDNRRHSSCAEGDQLLDCEINGDWDVLADRNMCFTLQNHKFIDEKFVELI